MDYMNQTSILHCVAQVSAACATYLGVYYLRDLCTERQLPTMSFSPTFGELNSKQGGTGVLGASRRCTMQAHHYLRCFSYNFIKEATAILMLAIPVAVQAHKH